MKSEIKNLCAPVSAADAASRRALRSLVLALLAVEFLDELTFGTAEAAWPLIRDDLALGYAEIGLLLSVPRIFGNLVEPPLFLAAEVTSRRALVVGGGAFYALALALIATTTGFWSLLLALMLISPAGGAFVGLSQAVLMDAEPASAQRAMFCSRRAGAASISAACESPTNAPAAGLMSISARSRDQKPAAAAMSTSESA